MTDVVTAVYSGWFMDFFRPLAVGMILGLSGWVFSLAGRLRSLEDWKESQKSEIAERKTSLDSALDAMRSFTLLTTKVEVLLETALRRLDIIEKHVFRL